MKLIAMVSMVTDHTAVFLYPQFIDKSLYEDLRAVGRLAFPIYAYLIVNGYQKTSSVKRYLTRLVAFALVSQVPWVLAADFTYLPNDSGLMVSLGSRWFVCLIFILVACVGWYCTVRADWSTAILGLALLAAVLRVEYAGIRILSDSLNVFLNALRAFEALYDRPISEIRNSEISEAFLSVSSVNGVYGKGFDTIKLKKRTKS